MSIRMMTSNIWGDYFGNPVVPRSPLLETVFERYEPDILGMQEVNNGWWNSGLIPFLNRQWTMVPVEPEGKMNYTPLFFRRERFELLFCGGHLFHEELDPSKGWTCGVFRDKREKKTFAVFNTHFWWKTALHDSVIRRYNAMEMSAEMKRVGDFFRCPVFFMGDLNCKVNSSAWQYFNGFGWQSSFLCTKNRSEYSSHHGDPVINPDGSCTGKATSNPVTDSIDHIGIPAGCRVIRQYAVIDREALDATDHSPVFADVEF